MTFEELKQQPDYQEFFQDTDPNLLHKFLEYHKNNHDLWALFQKFALEAFDSGRPRFSIWMIANRIRWYTQIETKGKDFKVSNDYLALYARFLMLKHPKLKGIFSIKKMKSKRTEAKE